MQAFFRMNQFTGFNGSPFSNGLSYDDFRKAHFNSSDHIRFHEKTC
jgi:hypothetical protein